MFVCSVAFTVCISVFIWDHGFHTVFVPQTADTETVVFLCVCVYAETLFVHGFGLESRIRYRCAVVYGFPTVPWRGGSIEPV